MDFVWHSHADLNFQLNIFQLKMCWKSSRHRNGMPCDACMHVCLLCNAFIMQSNFIAWNGVMLIESVLHWIYVYQMFAKGWSHGLNKQTMNHKKCIFVTPMENEMILSSAPSVIRPSKSKTTEKENAKCKYQSVDCEFVCICNAYHIYHFTFSVINIFI